MKPVICPMCKKEIKQFSNNSISLGGILCPQCSTTFEKKKRNRLPRTV